MKSVEHVPEYIRSLIPYEPGKPIEEVEREYGIANSVKLASNENPLGPSPKALAAIRAKLDELHLYPDGDCFYLKTGLAKKLGVSPEQLIFGNGSNEIIELAARTFMRAGDEAVMAEQAFVVYQLIVQAVGGKTKQVPLREYTHDLSAIAAAISPRTRIVFLANPNNPTGTIFRRDEWENFLAKVSPEGFADRRRGLLRICRRRWLSRFAQIPSTGSRDAHAQDLFQALRTGRLARRLRRGAQGIDRHDAARAPAL